MKENLAQNLINANENIWKSYLEHEFVYQIKTGKLKQEQFHFYLKQDLLFLNQYLKCYALLCVQARNEKELNFAIKTQKNILEVEQALHKHILQTHNSQLSIKDESLANLAYTRFVSAVALEGDFLDTLVALGPCALGYAHIGAKIAFEFGALEELNLYEKHKNLNIDKLEINLKDNPYKQWIMAYSSNEFFDTSLEFCDVLNGVDDEISQTKFLKLSEIFYTATRLEVNFWQHALEMKMDL